MGIRLPDFEDPEIMKRRRMLKSLGMTPDDYDGASIADMDEMIKMNQPADVATRKALIDQYTKSQIGDGEEKDMYSDEDFDRMKKALGK